MAHGGEAAHITTFQGNRLGQNGSDAIDSEQLHVCGCVLETFLDGLFQGFDLVAQAIKHREATDNRQDLVDFGQQALALWLGQLANPLDTEARTRIPYHDVLHTEHIRRVLADQVRALTQHIAHGSLGFRMDISLRQYP
jgi:hypothetical protein